MKKNLLVFLGALAACCLAVLAWILIVINSLPDVSLLKQYRPDAAAEVFDREDRILTQYYERKFRIRIPITNLPDMVIHAVTTAEDDTFFDHGGVNYRATWEALLHDVRQRRFARGGSTITQQMIKNVFLSREKTINRKIREYVLARRAEEILSKRRILEIYLNEVEWGENIYGIEAASRAYFDKHASELSAPEAALLAGMLPNPRFFDPLKRLDKAKARQDRVLFNMFQAKLLTEDEYGAAQTAPLALRTGSSGRFDLSALAGRNGRPCYQKILEQILLDSYSDHALYRQGIKVRTTLDKDLQERLCSWMREEHDNGGTAADHVAAAVRPPILVVKEGGQIRAIVCVRNAEAARLLLDSLNPREREYEVEEVLFSSIMMDDIIVSVETVGDGQELQTGR